MVDTGDSDVVAVQPQVALVRCLKAFVTLHNERCFMSWSNSGIDCVLNWLMNDTDDRQLQQVHYTVH